MKTVIRLAQTDRTDAGAAIASDALIALRTKPSVHDTVPAAAAVQRSAPDMR